MLLQHLQERRFVGVIGQQQLADHELVALPASERHEERQRAGCRAQARGLGVQADDGVVGIDGVRQLAQPNEVRGQPGACLNDGDGAGRPGHHVTTEHPGERCGTGAPTGAQAVAGARRRVGGR